MVNLINKVKERFKCKNKSYAYLEPSSRWGRYGWTNLGDCSGGGTTAPTPTAGPGGGLPSKAFAPYVDVMLYPTFSLSNCYSTTG